MAEAEVGKETDKSGRDKSGREKSGRKISPVISRVESGDGR
jgi:hypothetical protein